MLLALMEPSAESLAVSFLISILEFWLGLHLDACEARVLIHAALGLCHPSLS